MHFSDDIKISNSFSDGFIAPRNFCFKIVSAVERNFTNTGTKLTLFSNYSQFFAPIFVR